MSTFKVSPEALRDLSNRLNAIHDQLMGTGNTIRGFHGQLGSSDIDSHLDDFFNNWSDGMNKIEGNMKGVIDRLRNAADAYQQNDDSVAKAAHPS